MDFSPFFAPFFAQAVFVRTVDVKRTIGTTRASDGGQVTSVLRVFVDEAGNLVTAFPFPS